MAMELNLPDIRELHPGLRVGILLVPFFILWLLIYLIIYSPKIKKLRGYKTEITGLEQDFSHNLETIKNYKPPADKDRQEWQVSQALLWADSSPDEKLSQLVEKLARLAQESNISDISFTTKEKSGFTGGGTLQRMSRFQRMRTLKQKGQEQESLAGAPILNKYGYELSHIPIESAFKTGYQELARFLEAIKEKAPSLEIETMEIKREIPLISVTLVLKAHYIQKKANVPE